MLPSTSMIVPRWLRIGAWVVVALAFVLIVIGGFVTSFRVGMADRVWPTGPLFLFSNTHWEFGFVIEHSHRLAGWLASGVPSLIAVIAGSVSSCSSACWLRMVNFIVAFAMLTIN
jgi:heme a synthase